MFIIELILGIGILFFTFLAFFQINRTKFLLLNTFAILLIAISFYLSNGYIGVYSEVAMLIVHLIALTTKESYHKFLSVIVPPSSFVFFIYLQHHNLDYGIYDIFMPLAMTMFVFGVFQTDMAKNKLFFAVGLSFLLIYSFSIGALYVAFANFIGLFITMISFTNIETKNSKQET